MKLQDETIDFFDQSDESDEFFPSESGEEEVNSAFYDSDGNDDGDGVDEADIWKDEEPVDCSESTEHSKEDKNTNVVKELQSSCDSSVEETILAEKKIENETKVDTEIDEAVVEKENVESSGKKNKKESVDHSMEKKAQAAPEQDVSSTKKKKKDCCIM